MVHQYTRYFYLSYFSVISKFPGGHLIGVMSAEVVVLLNLLNDFDIFKLLTLFYFPIISSICVAKIIISNTQSALQIFLDSVLFTVISIRFCRICSKVLQYVY